MQKSLQKTNAIVANLVMAVAEKNIIMQTSISNKLSLQIVLTEEKRKHAIELLRQQQLPVSDIDSNTQLYLLQDDEMVVGTAGLEVFGDCGLLRSVSVIKEVQGKGYGGFITETMEKHAAKNGISCMYLLTTTAEIFFTKKGYTAVNSDDVPESIKQSTEFASVCPSSAVVMKKKI